ncbi:PucR family transcriptional regulator [Salimicrobium jeotgali]|uniref:PucR family transcription regulator n=3 Tax=Bacillaceae TaxID=186817 RepID=K2H7X3_9BACI|nr:PucR family transcriptional regulator [Salimicrobium jeotgali]EKE31770.1 PucR family transcription regulator [Salimicrobium jeotgali]SDX36494.1 purine catabolism regulatory protein [Salimicrobium album]
MGLLMSDIMELPVMEKSTLLTPSSLLHRQMVEWISVIETPVEDFVKQKEFVLSTGMGCSNDPKCLEQYTRDVIDSGASAIGFATGRYIFTIPDTIVEECKRNGVVLLEVPWEVRFGDIMQEVLQAISEEKREEQRFVEHIRQEMVDCVLNGEGLKEISSLVYEHTSIPVAISDKDRNVRANHYFDRKMIDILNQNEAGAYRSVPFTQTSYLEHHYPIEKYEFDSGECYQLTILSNHKKQGYLLFKEGKGAFSASDLTILEHAVTACALFFVKENAIEMTEIRLRDNFLLDLARENKEISDGLMEKGHLLGYNLEKPYVCIAGDIQFSKEIQTHVTSIDSNVASSSMHSRNYYVQSEIQHAADQIKRERMTAFEDGRVIIFLEADKESYMETTHQFLDLVERRLHELLAGITVSWGISFHGDGIKAFYESYQEAVTALRFGYRREEAGFRTFFADTKVNRLLLSISKNEEVVDLVTYTLKDLIEYDEKRQADLLHTFMVYNKYNSNVSQTARAMNLHRQSLLHRLRNIERLTGLSLLEADDFFLLELSVRMWMLIKE